MRKKHVRKTKPRPLSPIIGRSTKQRPNRKYQSNMFAQFNNFCSTNDILRSLSIVFGVLVAFSVIITMYGVWDQRAMNRVAAEDSERFRDQYTINALYNRAGGDTGKGELINYMQERDLLGAWIDLSCYAMGHFTGDFCYAHPGIWGVELNKEDKIVVSSNTLLGDWTVKGSEVNFIKLNELRWPRRTEITGLNAFNSDVTFGANYRGTDQLGKPVIVEQSDFSGSNLALFNGSRLFGAHLSGAVIHLGEGSLNCDLINDAIDVCRSVSPIVRGWFWADAPPRFIIHGYDSSSSAAYKNVIRKMDIRLCEPIKAERVGYAEWSRKKSQDTRDRLQQIGRITEAEINVDEWWVVTFTKNWDADTDFDFSNYNEARYLPSTACREMSVDAAVLKFPDALEKLGKHESEITSRMRFDQVGTIR